MQKECSKSKVLALVRILQRIEGGEDPGLVAQEVGKLAGEVGPGEIVAAQDRLRRSGYSDALVAQLCAAFTLMSVYEQRRKQATSQALEPHILQKMTAEHAMFRSLATDLERIVEDIKGLEYLSDTSLEFCRLAHTVHHLRAMNEHFDREEDVIFPYLARQGRVGLCRAATIDHAPLRVSIDKLTVLVTAVDELRLRELKSRLAPAITGFCRCLSEHLSFEDGLLWPIALVMMDDLAIWKTITAQCDEIGYCGIHA